MLKKVVVMQHFYLFIFLDHIVGLFSEAIETLVTAISLIKESRLGSDPQGIALMTPLKELLQGIEEQSIK